MIQNNQDLLSNDLQVSPTVLENLLTAAKWGKFLAIVGFISCALMILAGIGIGMASGTMRTYRSIGFNPIIFSLIYIFMGALFFFPCLYLFRFSSKMQDASRQSNQDSLETAMSNLKAMFRFMGIMTIIIICFYILLVIFLAMGTNRRY